MKKTYIQPELCIVNVQVEKLVAESFGVDSSTEVSEQYVKGTSSSTSRYNVWDDDWSE